MRLTTHAFTAWKIFKAGMDSWVFLHTQSSGHTSHQCLRFRHIETMLYLYSIQI